MATERTLFVYNPKAGKNFQLSLLDEIKSCLSQPEDVDFIAIQEFTKEDTQGYGTVVAVGGDGTVNTIAGAVANTNVKLGIVPKGSGDGLARHLNIPRTLKESIAVIEKGQTIKADTGLLSSLFFINVAGTGFEARVAHEFGKEGIRGLIGYVGTIYGLFFGSKEKEIEIELNGKSQTIKYFSLSIANGAQWGNNFEIASAADITDGELDIVAMRKPKWWQIPALISYLKTKAHKDTKLFSHYKAHSIKLTKAGKKWHIDGEPVKLKKKTKIKLLPKSIHIIVPQ